MREIARVDPRPPRARPRPASTRSAFSLPPARRLSCPPYRHLLPRPSIPYTPGTAPAVGRHAPAAARASWPRCAGPTSRAATVIGVPVLRRPPVHGPGPSSGASGSASRARPASSAAPETGASGLGPAGAPARAPTGGRGRRGALRARRAGDRDALGAPAGQRGPDPPPVSLGSPIPRTVDALVGRLHADVPPPRGDVAGGRADARSAPGRLRELGGGGRRRAARRVLDPSSRPRARRAISAPGRSPRPAVGSSGSSAPRPASTSRSRSVPGLVEGGFPARPAPGPHPASTRSAAGSRASARRRRRGSRARTLRPGRRLRGSARRPDATRASDAESGRPRVPSFLVLDLLEAVTGQRHDFDDLAQVPGWRTVPLHPACHPARTRDPLDPSAVARDRALAARLEPERPRCELAAGGPARPRALIRSREGTDALTVRTTASSATASTSETRHARADRARAVRVMPVSIPARARLRGWRRSRSRIASSRWIRAIEATSSTPCSRRRSGPGGARGAAAHTPRVSRRSRESLDAAFAAAMRRRRAPGADRAARRSWAGEQARLRRELRSALEAEADDPAGWRPARFESGLRHRGREADERLRSSTELPRRHHAPHSGPDRPARRLSRRAARTGPRLQDRAGSAHRGHLDRLARGRALQLPLYRLAAEALLAAEGTASVDEAQYYHVIGPDAGTRGALHPDGLGDPARRLRPRPHDDRRRHPGRPVLPAARRVRARPVRLRSGMRRRARAVGGGQARRPRGRDPRDPRGDRVTRPETGAAPPLVDAAERRRASRTSTPPSWWRPPRAAARRRCSSAAS